MASLTRAISIAFSNMNEINEDTEIAHSPQSLPHCDKCDGPCSIHILREYASHSRSATNSSTEEETILLSARADYATHHWNEGDPVECTNINCPHSSHSMLKRQRSVAEETHFWFCHHLPAKLSRPPLLFRQSTERYLALPANSKDLSLSPKLLLKKTRSVRYQGLLSQQVRKQRSDDVLTFGVQFICSKTEAKWKNPKQEVLNNELIKNKINAIEWNALVKSCKKYATIKHARRMQLTLKGVLGLKLYTDFDELQKELRKCYRTQDIKQQSHFFWWNNLLEKTSRKARDLIAGKLYHGASGLQHTSTFSGTYYGPVSTTRSLDTATQFSGKNGLVLELYPSYNRAGIRLSFLSNYPEEEEVLYMNTSFDVNDILDPEHGGSRLKPTWDEVKEKHEEEYKEKVSDECFKHWIELQHIAEKALKKMSIASNIFSLNHKTDGCVSGFSDLHCKEKVAMLTLLYLQYHVDDEHAGKDLKMFVKCCAQIADVLSNIRDQFIAIANNITGVRMFYLTPLIENYLTADPKTYKWPIQSDRVSSDVKTFADKYREKQPVKLQMIIRLFPTTQELILNGDNWDWSLQTFVDFLKKWHYDYSHNPLKYIKLKFVKQPGKEFVDSLREIASSKKDFSIDDIDAFDCKWNHKQTKMNKGSDAYDDEQATKLLQTHMNKARENVSKILRLGWRFVTPSKLEKMDSFAIPPELPFLLTFVDRSERNSALFYRSYTLNLLKSQSLPEFDEDGAYDNDYMWTDEQIEGSSDSVQKIEIDHNPKHCVLTQRTFEKIKYGAQLADALERRLEYTPLYDDEEPGANSDKDKSQTDSFENACVKVKVLVVEYEDDPLADRMRKLFYDTKTSHISYQTIYDIFPNVTDIFLKQTVFDEEECDRLKAFLEQEKGKCHLERIFYSSSSSANTADEKELKEQRSDGMDPDDDETEVKEDEDELKLEEEEYEDEFETDDDHTPKPKKETTEWLKTLNSINWDFVENTRIAINKHVLL